VRVQLQVGISEKLMIKIRRAQDLMSQKAQKPANLEATLESMVDLFLAKHDPLKKAKRQMIRGKLTGENQSKSVQRPGDQELAVPSMTQAISELSSSRVPEMAASKKTADRENQLDGRSTNKKPVNSIVDPQNNDSPLSGSRSDCRAISGNPNPRRRAGRIRTAAAKLTQSEDAPAADKAREDLRRMVGNGLNQLIKDSADQQLGGPVNTNWTKTTGGKRKPLPAATKHRVIVKHSGRCSHVNHQGERCRETKFLEIHHLKPIALGGGDHLENLTLLCSGHNRAQHLPETSTLPLPS
ncbi:MAG: HNH endonuclease, partial [Bdellovibrionales bacterium]|nr:HNH endonuclease [Bdellovibrionales bacterium]